MFGQDEAQHGMGQEVRAELEKLAKPGTNWTQAVIVLAISVLLFTAAGSVSEGMSLVFIGLLIVVILVHETGHLAAMWLFDYQDLRMFFVPFFGAAASGRKLKATGVQRAIVCLAGPLPGIFIGLILGILWLPSGSETLGWLAALFFGLNLFNLLPVMPLDGGRFLDTILFSRWPGVQLAVNLVTGGLLLLAGISWGDWILGGLGALTLLASRATFLAARLGRQLRQELPETDRASDQIPDSLVDPLTERLVTELRPSGGGKIKPKVIATHLSSVWQSVHNEPPRIAFTIILLFVYALTFVGPPILGTIAFAIGYDEFIIESTQNGEEIQTKIVSNWGRKAWEVDIDSDGAFHGQETTYGFIGSLGTVNGNWEHGFRHGTWT